MEQYWDVLLHRGMQSQTLKNVKYTSPGDVPMQQCHAVISFLVGEERWSGAWEVQNSSISRKEF